jgi:hypothetical protein
MVEFLNLQNFPICKNQGIEVFTKDDKTYAAVYRKDMNKRSVSNTFFVFDYEEKIKCDYLFNLED